MKFALNDRLHQPYRSRLITGFDHIKGRLAEQEHIIGTVISGAGPSILVIYEKNMDFEEIKTIINSAWHEIGVRSVIKNVNIDTVGAVITKSS
jgi:homoserine kinase